MRARAGDPPRTMPQKVLAGRAADPLLAGDLVQVKVDQVILSRAPARAVAEALAHGMKKTSIETAVAYDGTCMADAASLADLVEGGHHVVPPDLPAHNILIARPGIGFPGPVHLERFAAPARLALTDDPRMASAGGVGMLTLVASPAQLGLALATGSVWLRPPRSVQIHLSGRIRPFVCARDVSFELLRKGLHEVVRRIDQESRAPVVLEFVGDSARLLSVGERAVLCAIAPQVGAAAALFVSDEKTEVYLRDQRRSKAHRGLQPDQGAPCDEVMSLDLSTVDPLLIDEAGQVRPVRDLAGKPVSQVVLGGDAGVTLRDMLAAAMLLKSKRVPPRLDLIVAPPSRQVLEVLAQSGALVDLVATGARVIEPDRRVLTGEVYPPPGMGEAKGLSLRTFDPEPRSPLSAPFVVASAETLAYAVATGAIGDPRAFKRPVRVTVPRVLPTDDVLVVRDKKGDMGAARITPQLTPVAAWKAGATLDLVVGAPRELLESRVQAEQAARQRQLARMLARAKELPKPSARTLDAKPAPVVSASNELEVAVLAPTLDDLRVVAERLADLHGVRVVVTPFVPSGYASAFAAEGVVVLTGDSKVIEGLKGEPTITLPPPSAWGPTIAITAGKAKLELRWGPKGSEGTWTVAGHAFRGAGTVPPAKGSRTGKPTKTVRS
jgi:aconitate hydratase